MRIRRLQVADAAACVVTCSAVGWRSDEARWCRLLAIGDGFCAEAADGTLAGTVIVNRFGDRLATIAMMLVLPSLQRQGVGRRLLTEAMAAAGDAVVYLYATAEGRRLYEPFGFVADGALAERFEGNVQRDARAQGGVRAMHPDDLPAVCALDARAQGGARKALLEALAAISERALVVERRGHVVGFGLAWRVDDVWALAPIVAEDDAIARSLAAALAADAPVPVRIDLEPGERALREWAPHAGLVTVGTSLRMIDKGRSLPGDRRLVRAMAGRAYG